jgi:hypothetical protein
MRLLTVLIFAFLPSLALAQANPPPAPPVTGSDAPRLVLTPSPVNPRTTPEQDSINRLTQTNGELLDLLKKQQAVLEDIQFDRRLQSRQIESLEERLQETLLENTNLQNKIDKLNANPPAPAVSPSASANNAANPSAPSPSTPPPPTPPPKPSSYLSPAPIEVANGVPGWHRLFILSGSDNRNTDLFQIKGTHWRVLWHNQDPDGKAYVNTSALFLNAFPKDDTIPQKVCAKLGSGGDITDLVGPGNYYLKIEASGGNWELAVEDFH